MFGTIFWSIVAVVCIATCGYLAIRWAAKKLERYEQAVLKHDGVVEGLKLVMAQKMKTIIRRCERNGFSFDEDRDYFLAIKDLYVHNLNGNHIVTDLEKRFNKIPSEEEFRRLYPKEYKKCLTSMGMWVNDNGEYMAK